MMNTVQKERRGSKPTRDTSPELPQESSNIGFRDGRTVAFTKKSATSSSKMQNTRLMGKRNKRIQGWGVLVGLRLAWIQLLNRSKPN